MKKLVLLLQKSETELHLGLILAILTLASFAFSGLDIITTCISFTYTAVFPLYSYNSGFSFFKNQNVRLLNQFVLFLGLLISFHFFHQSYITLISLYYFGKINPLEKEILSLGVETNTKIVHFLTLGLFLWMLLMMKLRRGGIKSALKLAQNEKTPQT